MTVEKMTNHIRMVRLVAIVLAAGVLLISAIAPIMPVKAASQRILVIVNDNPITNRDVNQRMKLNAVLGDTRGSESQRRKRTLTTLIDEVIAKAEAKKLGVDFGDKQIDKTIADLAKGSQTTVDGLKNQLKKRGISFKTLRAQVEATMLLRWIIGRNSKAKIEVSEAEVDKRHNSLSSDPRLKPVTVYQIREVNLPLGAVTDANRPQLEYARAIEAQQIASRYKGCSSLKSAVKGIFNVQIGRLVQAPSDKLPGEMKNALRQAGTKKLIGPMRHRQGIQMVAYCGTRTIKPPKPPREAVKNMLLAEKYEAVADRVMRDLRRRAFIECKDKSGCI